MDVLRLSIICLRLACLSGLVATSITVTWSSVMWALALSASILFIKPKSIIRLSDTPNLKNPLKGKPTASVTDESSLFEELSSQMYRDIARTVLYSPTDVDSLQNFETIKQNSPCIFARKSKLWGCQSWKEHLSFEENVFRSIPVFIRFSYLCEKLGLDGFLFEVPHATDLKVFGESVRRVLSTLSAHDPVSRHCMDKSYIDRIGWVFEFNRVTCFVTTFAPFYPATSSRYSYGCENGYILIQPEISFAQHDIPSDTPETDWEHPRTVRDRIRVAFREAGMPYRIRETVRYPMVHDIVKPVDDSTGDVVEWWKSRENYNIS